MLTIDTIDIELTLYQVSVLSFDDDSPTNWPVFIGPSCDAIEVIRLEPSRNTTGVGPRLASLASKLAGDKTHLAV